MMNEQLDTIITKTAELEKELRRTGLWQKKIPAWVSEYDERSSISTTDFAQWLQFVFVPNHLQKNKPMPAGEQISIVPHAIKFLGDDVKKGKLLQILIELDSLL